MLWQLLWQAMANRNGDLHVLWGPSHKGESGLTAGLHQPWQFIANECADALADKAAETCQLPWAVTSIVSSVDARTRIVQNRLVAVHKLFSDAKCEDKAKEKARSQTAQTSLTFSPNVASGSSIRGDAASVPIEPFKNKEQRVAELKASSKHTINTLATVLKCTKCNTKCSLRGVGVEEWLKSECLPRSRPGWVHPTHQYAFSEPYHYCRVCGSRGATSRVVKLKVRCERPTAAGAKALAAFVAGTKPP